MQDLRAFGREKGWCPYFLARHMVQLANVVVYSYQYLLDPKVAGIISKEMQRESVVVFDEAHNIDNVCIEALSVSVRRQTLEGATRNINRMAQEIDRYAQVDFKASVGFLFHISLILCKPRLSYSPFSTFKGPRNFDCICSLLAYNICCVAGLVLVYSLALCTIYLWSSHRQGFCSSMVP